MIMIGLVIAEMDWLVVVFQSSPSKIIVGSRSKLLLVRDASAIGKVNFNLGVRISRCDKIVDCHPLVHLPNLRRRCGSWMELILV